MKLVLLSCIQFCIFKMYMQLHWSDQEDIVPLLPLSGESIVEQAGWIHTIRLARLIPEKVQTQ